mgnify:CR=1 FL=1
MIAIIDYDAGNIKSVEKALHALGEDAIITRNPEIILAADKVILPGVGAFGDAMGKIREYALAEVIHAVVDKNTPFLGICLGMQLLFESSEESPGVKGLGICRGAIHKIPEGRGSKVPQIGWNSLEFPCEGRLFRGVKTGAYVYFVHSYFLKATEPIVTATTEYVTTIHAAIEKNNVFACQFHPEKSSDTGLQILKNFIEITDK